jgi:uncharacterized protein
VHFSELTAPEQRVLGCLIEKRWTTPEQYPLSLNALRLACNQSTNRDPVTGYDEHTVREAAQRLSKYGLARLASGHTSRAIKYRHLAEEALGLGREELAVLSVLLLRGPQTPGELKGRSERMARFESLEAIDRVLEVLTEHGYVRRIERRPGQKEDRFTHLLGGEPGAGAAPVAQPAVADRAAGSPAGIGGGVAPVASSGGGVVPVASSGGGVAPVASSGGGATPGTSSRGGATPGTGGGGGATPGTAGGGGALSRGGVAPGTSSGDVAPTAGRDGNRDLERRLAALEAEVAALRAELAKLRD